MLFKKRSARESLSSKVGSITHSSLPNSEHINAIEESRHRGVLVRERFSGSTMQSLLQQSPSPLRENPPTGPFQYKVNRTDEEWRIEMQLLGGKLTKVSRNAYKRCLTFEGQITYCWKQDIETIGEKFEMIIPGEYDVTGDIDITKKYEEGKCVVVVPRRKLSTQKLCEDELV